MTVVPSVTAGDLRSVYDDYRAVAAGDAPDLVTTHSTSAARAALIRMLIADGWEAPAIVLDRLHADEEVLRPRLLVAS